MTIIRDFADLGQYASELESLAAVASTLVSLAASGGGTVGEIRPVLRASAPTGWLLLNGSSIGSASSGATTASADMEDLFTALWTDLSDTHAPVSSGRGASAAADWAANKTLTLPDGRGRNLIGAGTGAGLTARTLGDDSIGSEDAITVAHTHAAGSLTTTAISGVTVSYSASVDNTGAANFVTNVTEDSAGTVGGTTESTGSSGTGANIQPSLVVNWIIKI